MASLANAARTAKKAVKSSPSGMLQKPKGLAGAGAAVMALPYALKGLSKLTGGGDDDSDGQAAPGHGRGRRMPIQQSVDVAVPLKVAYGQWTQFENWPEFMHRIENVEQVDDAKVAFTSKIWGITKRFEAQIVDQHPDERIEWDVKKGVAHTGVATFHKLAPRLTRIEVTIDVEPDSLLEKAGRGMRFTKRAVRADLHRFKAFVEIDDEAENGWRGTIEDGDVKRRTERRSSNGGGPKTSTKSRARR
ncbi:MAG: SRPBCC family protein [Gaiellaceae bacterium]